MHFLTWTPPSAPGPGITPSDERLPAEATRPAGFPWLSSHERAQAGRRIPVPSRPREASGEPCAHKVMRTEGAPSRRGLAGGSRLPGRAGAPLSGGRWPGSLAPRAGGVWREGGPAFPPPAAAAMESGERQELVWLPTVKMAAAGRCPRPAASRRRVGGREAPPARPRALSKDGGERRSRVPGKGQHRDAFYFRVSASRRHIVLFVKTEERKRGESGRGAVAAATPAAGGGGERK